MNKLLIKQSTKWSAIAELSAKLISPLVNSILARILVPEVFGMIASFTLVTTFADVFTDAGFQKYLVQHKFDNDEALFLSANTAFMTNLSLSCLIWLVILINQSGIATLVGSPGYGKEIVILSLQIPLTAFSSIQTALFRREMRFKDLVPIRLATSAIPLIVTVPLALILKNCWSLIIGNLIRELINVVLLTINQKWKPTFHFDFYELKRMLSYSLWILADSIMIWATGYAGIFIVSRNLNAYYLGIYRTSIATITPYFNLIYAMTAPVLFSALSRTSTNENENAILFLDYQRLVSYVLFPMGIVCWFFRDVVTLILLGQNWMSASILLGLTGLSQSFRVIIAQYNSDYLRAIGKPRIAFFIQISYFLSMLLLLTYATQKSFSFLCVVSGLNSFVYVIISSIFFYPTFRGNKMKLLLNLSEPFFATAVLCLIYYFLVKKCQTIIMELVVLVIGLMCYFSILYFFSKSRKDLRILIDFIKKINIKEGN